LLELELELEPELELELEPELELELEPELEPELDPELELELEPELEPASEEDEVLLEDVDESLAPESLSGDDPEDSEDFSVVSVLLDFSVTPSSAADLEASSVADLAVSAASLGSTVVDFDWGEALDSATSTVLAPAGAASSAARTKPVRPSSSKEWVRRATWSDVLPSMVLKVPSSLMPVTRPT
jgi:hypothetical protein